VHIFPAMLLSFNHNLFILVSHCIAFTLTSRFSSPFPIIFQLIPLATENPLLLPLPLPVGKRVVMATLACCRPSNKEEWLLSPALSWATHLCERVASAIGVRAGCSWAHGTRAPPSTITPTAKYSPQWHTFSDKIC
jgi:hypothetical protein